MQYDFNAKTQRRKGAELETEIGSLVNVRGLVTRNHLGKILFASLRLRFFGLKSFCLSNGYVSGRSRFNHE